MDHKQQHHEHHRKEREEKKRHEEEHEREEMRQPRSIHPGWFIGIAVIFIGAAVVIWMIVQG